MQAQLLLFLAKAGPALGKLLMSLFNTLLTQGVFNDLALMAIKQVSKSTDNTVDDTVVSVVEKALGKKPKPKVSAAERRFNENQSDTEI